MRELKCNFHLYIIKKTIYNPELEIMIFENSNINQKRNDKDKTFTYDKISPTTPLI